MERYIYSLRIRISKALCKILLFSSSMAGCPYNWNDRASLSHTRLSRKENEQHFHRTMAFVVINGDGRSFSIAMLTKRRNRPLTMLYNMYVRIYYTYICVQTYIYIYIYENHVYIFYIFLMPRWSIDYPSVSK